MSSDAFGALGVSGDDALKVALINGLMLQLALEAKGVITIADIEAHRAVATSTIDQCLEERVRERNAEMLEELPGLSLFAKLMGEEIPLPITNDGECRGPSCKPESA